MENGLLTYYYLSVYLAAARGKKETLFIFSRHALNKRMKRLTKKKKIVSRRSFAVPPIGIWRK